MTESNGKLYLFIGFTGTGKSTLVMKMIKNNNHIVFDINKEPIYANLPTDNKKPKSRFIGDYDEFIATVETKKNTFAVFEDATGFFRGRANKQTMRLIVKKRHANNNYLFLFHSINQTPKDLILLANVIILYKTNDIPEDVERKFARLLPAFREVNASKNNFEYKILKLQ